MFKPLIVAALLALSQPVFAETDVDALYVMVDAGDFAQAEALLSKTYAAVDRPAQDYDQLRDLVGAFSVTDPRVAQFTSDWLAEDPQSLHARAARGWYLYAEAFAYRGSASGADTHPLAHQGFVERMEQAAALAQTIVADDPAYVPGSDLLMATLARTGRSNEVPAVLDAAMKVSPNLGSVIRAISFAGVGWGGPAGAPWVYCDAYLEVVKIDPPMDNATCALMLQLEFDPYARQSWGVAADLEASTHPLLQAQRMRLLMEQAAPPSDAQVAELLDYVDPATMTNVPLAALYDRIIALPKGEAPVTPEVKLRRFQELTALAERDPYNFYHQDERMFLAMDLFAPDDPRWPDPVLDIYGPAAMGAPYSVEIWTKLSQMMALSNRPEVYNSNFEPFAVNAFVLGGDVAMGVYDYASNSYLAWARTKEQPLAPERMEELACNTIRALRYSAHLCAETGMPKEQCEMVMTAGDMDGNTTYAPVAEVLAEIEAGLSETACPDFRSGPVEGLAYDYQPFDLKAYRAKIGL